MITKEEKKYVVRFVGFERVLSALTPDCTASVICALRICGITDYEVYEQISNEENLIDKFVGGAYD